jgi:hypothetical protein
MHRDYEGREHIRDLASDNDLEELAALVCADDGQLRSLLHHITAEHLLRRAMLNESDDASTQLATDRPCSWPDGLAW